MHDTHELPLYIYQRKLLPCCCQPSYVTKKRGFFSRELSTMDVLFDYFSNDRVFLIFGGFK